MASKKFVHTILNRIHLCSVRNPQCSETQVSAEFPGTRVHAEQYVVPPWRSLVSWALFWHRRGFRHCSFPALLESTTIRALSLSTKTIHENTNKENCKQSASMFADGGCYLCSLSFFFIFTFYLQVVVEARVHGAKSQMSWMGWLQRTEKTPTMILPRCVSFGKFK